MEIGEGVYMATQGKNKVQAKQKEKSWIPISYEKDSKCSFYKKKGHMKKDCNKFETLLKKEGNPITLVYYERNMVDICHNTWWMDSDFTIHVWNTLQGFLNQWKLIINEQCI